jgi:hypothetical protein
MRLCLAHVGTVWLLQSQGPQSATLHFSDFLSADGKVWCSIGSQGGFCVTGGGDGANAKAAQRSAALDIAGKVTLCYVAVPSASKQCTQNWDSSAPTLAIGQQTQLNGILCKAGSGGISCTLASGPKGKGFLINGTSARRLGS